MRWGNTCLCEYQDRGRERRCREPLYGSTGKEYCPVGRIDDDKRACQHDHHAHDHHHSRPEMVGQRPERAAESIVFAATVSDADPDTYWGPTQLGQARGPVGP